MHNIPERRDLKQNTAKEKLRNINMRSLASIGFVSPTHLFLNGRNQVKLKI